MRRIQPAHRTATPRDVPGSRLLTNPQSCYATKRLPSRRLVRSTRGVFATPSGFRPHSSSALVVLDYSSSSLAGRRGYAADWLGKNPLKTVRDGNSVGSGTSFFEEEDENENDDAAKSQHQSPLTKKERLRCLRSGGTLQLVRLVSPNHQTNSFRPASAGRRRKSKRTTRPGYQTGIHGPCYCSS